MNQEGKLLVFEGPDGVGKTTLSTALARSLEESGLTCDLLSFPGNEPGTLGRLVYDVHHFPQEFEIRSMSETSRQLLHVAAHVDAIEQRILPALSQKRIVILDRFWWSTWAYGMLAQINRKTLGLMIKVELAHWGMVVPSVAFLVTRPRMTVDLKMDQTRLLSAEYTRLAKREGNHYPVHLLKNYGNVEETLAEILSVIHDIDKPRIKGDLMLNIRRRQAAPAQGRERSQFR